MRSSWRSENRVAAPTSHSPALSQAEIAERQARAKALAAQFKTELLIP
jgi:hypothetical protein